MHRSSEERFHDIYQGHVDAVTAYVRRRSPADSVEDVVAETFLVCWRKLEGVPEEPLPWLYAVARKTLANQRRAMSRNALARGAMPQAQSPRSTAIRCSAARSRC
jgi:RNA polymerase sigma-70 factor, ECF subfamily